MPAKLSCDEIRALLFSGKRIYDIPLRVTYYGRVSTDEIDQLASLKNQVSYFEEKIKANSNWTFVNGYIDEGISGTTIGKRAEFIRMLQDAKHGKFDLILTKEVSRFARDIVDAVQTVRNLLSSNIGVIFEDLQLNTFEKDAEFRLSIMAIVAQEESRKISDRVRFGYKQTSKSGKRHGAAPPLGYVFNNENNGYSIDPVTSMMVKLAFKTYAEKEIGIKKLGLFLAEQGYLNSTGKPYSATTLKRMFRHPVYMGYMVNGKSYKQSYRDDKIIDVDKKDWILHHVPDRVPPLISQDLWEKVNRILDVRRDKMRGVDTSNKDEDGGGRYAYSGKIFCGNDGARYVHAVAKWKKTNGDVRVKGFWRCGTYVRNSKTACSAPLIYETALDSIMRQVFVMASKNVIEKIKDAGKTAYEMVEDFRSENTDIESKINEIKHQIELEQQKKDKLISGWASGLINDEDLKRASGIIDSTVAKLSAQHGASIKLQGSIDVVTKKIDSMHEVLNSVNMESKTILDSMIRTFLKSITIKVDEDDLCIFDIVLQNQECFTPHGAYQVVIPLGNVSEMPISDTKYKLKLSEFEYNAPLNGDMLNHMATRIFVSLVL